jgi:hypothetical protein
MDLQSAISQRPSCPKALAQRNLADLWVAGPDSIASAKPIATCFFMMEVVAATSLQPVWYRVSRCCANRAVKLTRRKVRQ